MRSFLFLFLLFLSPQLHAQEQFFGLTSSSGLTFKISAIASTADSGVVVAFNNENVPGILKMNRYGQLEWAKTLVDLNFPATNTAPSFAVYEYPSQTYHLVYSNRVNGNEEVGLTSFNAFGGLIASKKYNVTMNGNVDLMRNYSVSSTGQLVVGIYASQEMHHLKLDAQQNLEWTATFTNTTAHSLNSSVGSVFGDDGHVYVASSMGYGNIHLMELDSSGAIVKSKYLENSEYQLPLQMKWTSSGTLMILGESANESVFIELDTGFNTIGGMRYTYSTISGFVEVDNGQLLALCNNYYDDDLTLYNTDLSVISGRSFGVYNYLSDEFMLAEDLAGGFIFTAQHLGTNVLCRMNHIYNSSCLLNSGWHVDTMNYVYTAVQSDVGIVSHTYNSSAVTVSDSSVIVRINNYCPTTVGIPALKEDDDFTFDVYPNPSNGNITVDVSGVYQKQQLTSRLVDSQGRLLKTDFIHAKTTPLDLSYLPKGIYFLSLNGVTKKVCVTR